MTLRYETGPAFGLVKDGAVVLLPEGVSPSLLDELWGRLGGDAGIVELIQVLTGAFGSSLRSIPPFAAVVVRGRRVQVAVRGELSVTVGLAGESVHVSGVNVTTWSERTLEGVESVSVQLGTALDVPPPPGGAGTLDDLPVVAGIVLTRCVRTWLVEPSAAVDVVSPAADVVGPPADPAPAPEVVSVRGPASEETIAPDQMTFAEVPAGAAADAGVPGADTVGDLLGLPADVAAGAPDDEPEAAPVGDDGYGHLWGSTVLRTVEEAAVRVEESDEEHDDAGPPVPGPPTVAGSAAAPEVPAPVPGTAPAPSSLDALVGPPTDLPAADGSGVISGVPREWTGATPAAVERAAHVAVPEQPGAPTDAEVDDHDGHTVFSSAIADLRAAAASAAEHAPPGPSSGEPTLADELLSVPPAPPAPPVPGPGAQAGPAFDATPSDQQILARCCAQGHPNPPSRDTCAQCGGGLESDAQLVARPSLGRVVLSNGQVVELDRSVVVGRRPRSQRGQSSELPRLVTVASPQQDISRSHVEIRLEDWHVLVSDLRTTNGTTLLRPGQPARRLHPGEAVMVATDDVVDLGDGVTMTFEGLL
ncbi:FHA domain-containing protein [Oerskovia flava]|uniref:FHA domain-containing protein n=1 Tax=Oerskovia flava TaxID=2986422 RepID=UPI00224059B4|nr:FHA domain-containing protein [Oerskovia sp. JB1-3-2]